MDTKALLAQIGMNGTVCLATTFYVALDLRKNYSKMTAQCLGLLMTTHVWFAIRVSRILLVNPNDTSMDKKLIYFFDYFIQATLFFMLGLVQAQILGVFKEIMPWITSARLKVVAILYVITYVAQVSFFLMFDDLTNFKTRSAWHILGTNIAAIIYISYGIFMENLSHVVTLMFLYNLRQMKSRTNQSQTLYFLISISVLMTLTDIIFSAFIFYGMFHPLRTTVGQFWITVGCNHIGLYIAILSIFWIHLKQILPRKKQKATHVLKEMLNETKVTTNQATVLASTTEVVATLK